MTFAIDMDVALVAKQVMNAVLAIHLIARAVLLILHQQHGRALHLHNNTFATYVGLGNNCETVIIIKSCDDDNHTVKAFKYVP